MPATDPSPTPTDALIVRSNRLGADPRTTNYGGGNTSAKATVTDPVSLDDVDVMWIKGSGGDLGTLTADGLSVLRLDRLRALERRHRGIGHGIDDDDELHQLLDHCGFGPPGAPPSIDTSMHGLLRDAHVDHLHPDSVIAIAACADGEALTERIFGDEIGWVPWQRPGFDLAVRIRDLRDAQPQLAGVIMGGHGLTTWADTSERCERISLGVIRTVARFIERNGRPQPLGPLRPGFEPLDPDERRRRAERLAPVIRGLASTDRPVVGRWCDATAVVDFVGRQATPRLVPLGTSCPDHFIRTKVRPLLLDLPTAASFDDQVVRLGELHAQYRTDYRRYYAQYANAGTPPMRGADPAIVLVPGVGMFSFGADAQTARLAGEFYVNAMNVINGAEAVSSYQPVPEREKFRIEYWMLEELKLRRRPAPGPLTGKVAVVTGAGAGAGRAVAQRCAEAGAGVVAVDADAAAATRTAVELGGSDAVLAVGADVSRDDGVTVAIGAAARHFSGVDVVVETTGAASPRLVAGAAGVLPAECDGLDVVVVGEAGFEATGEPPGSDRVRVNRVEVAAGATPDLAAAAVVALVDGSFGRTGGRTIRVGDDLQAGR